jgi:hypothetical protein
MRQLGAQCGQPLVSKLTAAARCIRHSQCECRGITHPRGWASFVLEPDFVASCFSESVGKHNSNGPDAHDADKMA